MKKFAPPLLLAIFAIFAAACETQAQFLSNCQVDTECPTGAFCRIASGNTTGLCACRGDDACAAGEVCNSQGICQKRQDCRSNSECDPAKFCDLGSGQCLERTQCGLDLHCLPGQVCNNERQVCEDGCLDTADCPLYQVCQANRCVTGRCGDKTFCDYGQRCVNGACVRVNDPNSCRDCDPRTAGSCGSPDNFCLINNSYDPDRPDPARTGGPNFCGIDCSDEEDCPSGYNCNNVVLLTSAQCTRDAECGGGGRRCEIGEGQLRGFCTCAANPDCAFNEVPPTCLNDFTCAFPQGQFCGSDDQCQALPICAPSSFGGPKVCATDGSLCNDASTCQCFNGRCIQSGRTCRTSADCNLSCVGGGCLLGSACAPLQGLLCPDVR